MDRSSTESAFKAHSSYTDIGVGSGDSIASTYAFA
jgi:hypothetical protein